MRFLVMVKANKDSEAGVMPSHELVSAMGRFNEEMAKAGVMLAGEGLHPTSKGARVRFSKGKPTVTRGPFPESKDLIAGFWMIQAKSLDEALEWMKRSPAPWGGGEGELELRPVFEAEDFPPEVLSPEEAEREEKLRKQLQQKAAVKR